MNTIDHQSLLLQMRMLAARAQGLQETTVPAATPAAQAGGVDFGQALKSALDRVNDTQQTARALSDKFDAGDPKIDMAEVMVAIQKANVSFQAVTQVRNKLVSAYQDIMNMPI
ncbi:MAG: flagellar hook-basal body complex protein FliE [Gammaproteobacteria bacterium]